jgi:hypothetical protein
MLGAGIRQFAVWGDTEEGRHILIAVARYLVRVSRDIAKITSIYF